MNTKTMLCLCTTALLGTAFLPARADEKAEKPGPEAELKPLIRHVIAPRRAIDLCGEWDFVKVKCTPEKYPDPKNPEKQLTHWNRTDVSDFNKLEWTKIHIPKAFRHIRSDEYSYFRKYVNIPADAAGKRVMLKLEKVVDSYNVTVNGKIFSGAATVEMPWENDITDAVKPGEKNEIIVEVFNGFPRRQWADSPFQHEWALAGYWGISRPLHLEIYDPVYIDSVAVRTNVLPEKILTVKTLLRNTTSKDMKAFLNAAIPGEWNLKSPETLIPANGQAEVVLTKKWDGVKLWNPETPNLYCVDLTLVADGKMLDAYRQRFGFREIGIRKHQFLLNGKPYMHRRTTHTSDDVDPGSGAIAKNILTLRDNGILGMRLFGGDWVRWAETADEVGAMLTPVAPGGGGAAWKSEKFWPVFASYHARMVKILGNHPSVMAWALGNEFGTIYGGNEGGPLEKPTTEKQVELGKKMEQLDPTRPWTYCGEVELGYPVKGSVGPAPIRSFHYPISTCRDGITMPESGYWYAKGELSWHRISTKDKPTVISEDIYHGTTDQHLGMAKTGGDSIYTTEGYAKTLHHIIRCFAEGYYFSGLGGWETWVTYQHRGNKNLLNRLGPLMPHFLIALRENYPNLRGGDKVERNIYSYNQLFTPYDCELIREDFLKGKKVFTETRKFLLDQGEKHHEKITIDVPKVRKPTPYQLKFTLKIGDRVLTDRTYDYTVFPPKTEIDVNGRTALLASPDSILRKMDFSCGVYNTAEEVLKSGAKAIVVDKSLSNEEGRKLNDFVLNGGNVLFIEAAETSWTPLMIEFRRPLSFLWRRNDDRMKSLDESWMRAWMPDHTLGDSSYPKPVADAFVLWDCGQREGLSNANILWLNRGKGAWMLCQLPVLSRFFAEPAAPHVLQAVMNEFTDDIPELKGLAVASPSSSAGELLRNMKIEFNGKIPERNDVLVMDASQGLGGEQLLALEAHTGNRGTVLLLEVCQGNNKELLKKLGLKLSPFDKTTMFVWGAVREIDRTPKWLVRKNNSGLLAGITSEDMFWTAANPMEPFMMERMCGSDPWFSVGKAKPVVTGKVEALPGADVEILTDPAGIAVCEYNRGKVVVVTLKFSEYASVYPARAARLVRTLLNNLGAATVTPERVHEYQFLDISNSFNRGLWNDPLYQKKDGSFEPVGWFGTDNDMRYFPVNLCGWSMAARNFCPKEPFPTEPMNLGGIKFQLSDPAKNKGRGCLVLEPGKSIRIPMSKDLKAQKLFFLGAQSGVESGPMLELRFPSVKEPVIFNGGDGHFGTYRWAASVKNGNVAWSGETLKDDQASLYNWFGVNPYPEKAIPWIELKNMAKKDSVAIIAMTAELPDKQ